MSYYQNPGEDLWGNSGGATGDTSARGGSAHELYASRSNAREESTYGRATSSRDVFQSSHDEYGGGGGGGAYGGGGARNQNVGIGIGYKSPPRGAATQPNMPRVDSYSEDLIDNDRASPRKRSPNEPGPANNSNPVMPLPVEGQALPPNVGPVEPPMPQPKASKRFPANSKRQPDMMLGKVVDTDKSTVRGEAHLVNCMQCRCRMKVKKFAVVVRCPDCSHVSPASSTKGVKNV